MKCPKCHLENPSDTNFCGKCGTPLPSSEEISVSQTKTFETTTDELTRGSSFAERYEVIEELGKGGMGNVYRVFDKKIKEEVALKLLKPEIASDKKTIERFSNELKFARKIRHKNVCQMYELMEEEGIHFITMEYVPGEDLKSFIRRARQLTAGTAVALAKQVCEGLVEAHRLGVVHRDLKPSNIMIDKEGNARIMDFGIARSLKAEGITGDGVIIGTPEYMSPEQVEGKEVDLQSDIYSLGVILYEMVIGTVPFEGDTPLSIAHKHKYETAQEPKEVNAQIPEDLNQMIMKCLEKDKERRYQSAGEVWSELENIERGIPTTDKEIPRKKPLTSKEITVTFGLKKLLIPVLAIATLAILVVVVWQLFFKKGPVSIEQRKPSIAVLPFEDLSPQKDHGHLSDGFPDELINRLTKIEGLRVPARTSSFSIKGKGLDIREIGEKLKVKNVLEGSVKKEGKKLRITIQLINVEDGYPIWSEKYERNEEHIFDLQDEISLAIVDKLKLKLLGEEKAKLVKRHTENLEAYNLYLRGDYYSQMMTPDGSKQAIEYYERALKKDPNYALAYCGMAGVYISSSFFAGYIRPHEAFPKARAYVEKALELNPNLAEAHAELGAISMYYDWNWKSAERELKHALQLAPNSADIHYDYSHFLTITGRHEEAITEATRTQELDPLSRTSNALVSTAYLWARQYDRVIEDSQMTINMHPNYFFAHLLLGRAYQGKSMIEEAIAEFKKAVDLSGGHPTQVIVLALTYYECGKKAEAEKLFDELQQRSRYEYVAPLFLFFIHLFHGDHDKATEWLERACEERDSWIPWFINFPIESHSIPDEPRYQAVLEKYGLK